MFLNCDTVSKGKGKIFNAEKCRFLVGNLENKKIHEHNGFKDCTQLASPFIRDSGKSYVS